MRRLLIALLCSLVLLPIAGHSAAPGADRVLIFTHTAMFQHDSIPLAVATLRQLSAEAGLTADKSDDPRDFRPDNLARYRAVVFANTTGDVLDAAQQAAMEQFIRNGGGFMGVHAAADTEYDWPWYGELVGAWFHQHPSMVAAAGTPGWAMMPRCMPTRMCGRSCAVACAMRPATRRTADQAVRTTRAPWHSG